MGELSKTANDMSVAINIWRSIHNPVTESIIRGNKPIINMDVNDSESERLLESDDVYYSRNIPRDAMFSYNMLQFHNLGIKRMLYSKPTNKGNLVELACGEGGDMPRWIDNGYKFILGIDLVKNNIYGPRTGAYSRMLENRKRYFRNLNVKDKVAFPNMVFVAGDCGKSIVSVSKLFSHILSHTQEKPYSCTFPGCGMRFGYQGNLHKHYKGTHEGIKRYTCDHCGKGYTKKFNLNKHLASVKRKELLKK